MNPHWLPPLVPWNPEKEGQDQYLDRLLHIFTAEFQENPILFRGERVTLKRSPYHGMYPWAFTHITTCDSKKSGERKMDLARCERIRWPRPVIEHHDTCNICDYGQCNKPWVWKNRKRVKIYLPDDRYLVVLEERRNTWLFITAYQVNWSHSAKQIEKEYRSEWSNIIQ